MATSSTQHSKIYRDFNCIEPDNFYAIIQYFERYEQQISELLNEEYFDCLVAYANAIFLTQSYKKFTAVAETILIFSIEQNIQFRNGEDLYAKMLYRKAFALLELSEPEKAAHIFREILKMYPNHKESVKGLEKALQNPKPDWLKNIRHAVLIGILFSAAGIMVAEWLRWSNTATPYFYKNSIRGSFLLLTCSLFSLILGELIFFLKIKKQIAVFRSFCKNKKRNC